MLATSYVGLKAPFKSISLLHCGAGRQTLVAVVVWLSSVLAGRWWQWAVLLTTLQLPLTYRM